MNYAEAHTSVDSFRSVATPAAGLFKDRGSRFISKLYPVETEVEIKDIIAGLHKEYHDARHCCYAYRLGYTGEKYRANDDGEPSGTAGRPILGQLDSAGLSDVLLVVVRYFGGIKLGVPGLIRAYKEAAADAIGQAEVVEKIASKRFALTFDYMDMNGVMKVVKELGLEPRGQDFGTSCRMELSVRLSLVETFLSSVGNVEGCAVGEM